MLKVTIHGKEYITIGEAAKLLKVSTKTIYRWIESGDLYSVKHLNRRFVSLESVKEKDS